MNIYFTSFRLASLTKFTAFGFGLSRQLQIYPRYLRKGFRVNPFEPQFPFQLNINNTKYEWSKKQILSKYLIPKNSLDRISDLKYLK